MKELQPQKKKRECRNQHRYCVGFRCLVPVPRLCVPPACFLATREDADAGEAAVAVIDSLGEVTFEEIPRHSTELDGLS